MLQDGEQSYLPYDDVYNHRDGISGRRITNIKHVKKMADIKVYGTLRTMATDGIVATADQLKDTNVGKFQEVINQELAGGMEGKQDTIADLEQIRSLANSAVQPSVLQAAIADFITKSVDDLVNYYKKSETYTKAEVNGLIGAVKQFTYRVASSLPTASESTMYIIYLIPSSNASTQNVKDEFITIQDGSSYSWEQIGSTKIDLSGYSTTEETTMTRQVSTNSSRTMLTKTAFMKPLGQVQH